MAKTPDLTKARHGLDLIDLFEQPHGQALRQTLEEVYAEMLSGFTKDGLTTEELRRRYDELQGFLAFVMSMGVTMENAKFLIAKHQEVARRNLEEVGLGDDGGSP